MRTEKCTPAPFGSWDSPPGHATEAHGHTLVRLERAPLGATRVVLVAKSPLAAAGWLITIDLDETSNVVGAGLQAPTTANRWTTSPAELGAGERWVAPPAFGTRTIRDVAWPDAVRAARRFALLDDLRDVAPAVEFELDETGTTLLGTREAIPGCRPRKPTHEAIASLQRRLPATTKRPGPPAKATSDFELARLAARYVEILESDPRNPTRTIAAEWNISRSTAASRLHTARERGLLTNAPVSSLGTSTGGQAGGELTEKAKHILEQGANR